MKAKTKSATNVKETKAVTTRSHKKAVNKEEPEVVVKQLNRDVRDSILVVSVLINAYFLIAWLVLQVTDRFDASLIGYLQNH
jgi:hypothetical protein